MCNQNYKKYIDSGNQVTYKKYLYAMRGLVSAKYILLRNKLPNINFPELLIEIKGEGIVEDRIVEELLNIVRLRKELKEKEIVRNYKRIDEYIENFLKEEPKLIHLKKPIDKSSLNKEILKIFSESKNC